MNDVIDMENAVHPDLSGRRVVIAGGTGDVGEGIVRAWLKSGAQVIVPSRSEAKIARFREAIADLGRPEALSFTLGAAGSFAEAEAAAERIAAEFGPVTDVVAALGGWRQGGPLWELSEADWGRYFLDISTAHAAAARAWIPRLPREGGYQLILGGSATTPVPGASMICMQQAALLMMRRVLSAELGGEGRVSAQVLGPVVTRARRSVKPEWVSNLEVGLVTLGVAADPQAGNRDYFSEDKTAMRETLRALGVYSG